jgi:hypothetical protein
MVAHVVSSIVRRLEGRVRPCEVCTVHVETRKAGFLVEPQNQGPWFVSSLTSKPLGWFLLVWPQNRWRRFLPIWPQNRWRRVSRFGPQNWQLWFDDLDIKITVMISWFRLQNQAGYGLSVATQNRREDDMAHGTCRDVEALFT